MIAANRMLLFLVILASALFANRDTALARTLKEHLPDYEITLPDGFVEMPEMLQANPQFVHFFVKGQPQPGETIYALAIQKLGGVMDRRPLEKKHLPPNLANATISTAHWQGFDITLVESVQELQGVKVFNLAAQIPLKQEAIQVMLAGDPGREAELRADMQMVLKNLCGQSNWVQSALPGITDNKLVLLIVTAGLIALGLVMIYRIAVQKSYQSATLTAFGMLVASNLMRMQGSRMREMFLITGVLGLTGTLGLLMMGFLALRRRWKQKEQPDTAASETISP